MLAKTSIHDKEEQFFWEDNQINIFDYARSLETVFLAALALFFAAGFWPGMSWLVIAFLISPYGLPMAAAWLVGMIGGVNGALKDFIFG